MMEVDRLHRANFASGGYDLEIFDESEIRIEKYKCVVCRNECVVYFVVLCSQLVKWIWCTATIFNDFEKWFIIKKKGKPYSGIFENWAIWSNFFWLVAFVCNAKSFVIVFLFLIFFSFFTLVLDRQSKVFQERFIICYPGSVWPIPGSSVK